MGISRYTITLSLLVAVGAGLLSCATAARIRVDPTIETESSSFEINVPDQWMIDGRLNISFGPYRVTNADRGWTHSSHKEPRVLATEWLSVTFGDDPFLTMLPSIESTKTKLSYLFADGTSDPSQVRCAFATRRLKAHIDPKTVPKPPFGLSVPTPPAMTAEETVDAKFKCLSSQISRTDLSLALDIYTHGLYRGILTAEHGTYRITRSFSTQMVRSDGYVATIPVPIPVGYEIFLDDRRVGAVINHKHAEPRVFVGTALDETSRHAIAEAASALILFDMAFDDK